MSWVLSMGVVEGLSAEAVAGRLEAELGEETTGDSPNGEEAGAGPGLPAVGIHGDGRAVILDDRDADAPILEDARLLARLSRGTRVVLFELSERVNCGLFRVGCWVDGAMAWQIIHCRDEPETEEYQILGVPPGIFADKAAPYRAQQAQADAAGEDTCYLGQAVVELFVSLTGLHYDRDGWWWDLRYRDLRPIDRPSGCADLTGRPRRRSSYRWLGGAGCSRRPRRPAGRTRTSAPSLGPTAAGAA